MQLLEKDDTAAAGDITARRHHIRQFDSQPGIQPGTVAALLAELLAARPQLHSRGGDTAAVPYLTARLATQPPPGHEVPFQDTF